MNRHKNAPIEQAQNLWKGHKMGNPEKDFEDIPAATSECYSKALEKLADGESSGRNEDPNSSCS